MRGGDDFYVFQFWALVWTWCMSIVGFLGRVFYSSSFLPSSSTPLGPDSAFLSSCSFHDLRLFTAPHCLAAVRRRGHRGVASPLIFPFNPFRFDSSIDSPFSSLSFCVLFPPLFPQDKDGFPQLGGWVDAGRDIFCLASKARR